MMLRARGVVVATVTIIYCVVGLVILVVLVGSRLVVVV